MNPHMNKTTFCAILMVAFVCTCCTKQQSGHDTMHSAKEIDSIYVLATDLDLLTVVNVGRDDFMSYYNEHPLRYSKIIKDDSCKNCLCTILENLERVPDCDSVMAAKRFMYKPLHKGNRIYWINTDKLDVRTLLVLFTNNDSILVWVSSTYTVIGDKCYRTSDALRSYIDGKFR